MYINLSQEFVYKIFQCSHKNNQMMKCIHGDFRCEMSTVVLSVGVRFHLYCMSLEQYNKL